MNDLSTIFPETVGYLLKRIVGGRRRRNAGVLNKMFEWDGTYITKRGKKDCSDEFLINFCTSRDHYPGTTF